MKKGARVLGSVKESETEFKTFLETQIEEHNKILKNLARLQKHHHKTCNPATPKEYKKIIVFS